MPRGLEGSAGVLAPGECILSQRDSMIVARHEMPGVMRKNSPVSAGRSKGSRLRLDASPQKSPASRSDELIAG
jgi:hypothetical protein